MMAQHEETMGKKIYEFMIDKVVMIIFILFVIFGFIFTEVAAGNFANEMLARFFRNALLVLSLIIPVMAGLGLNFGIVIGSMAGMLALIFVRYHYTIFIGFPGLLAAFAIATPIAILFGYLTGKLYNKTKGQEMVASLIVGFFADALYLVFVLWMIGGLIPVAAGHRIMNPGDPTIGVAHTLDLGLPAGEITARHGDMLPGVARALNNLWQIEFVYALVVVAVFMFVYVVIRRFVEKKNPAMAQTPNWLFITQLVICVAITIFAIYSAIGIYYWYNVLAEARLENARMGLHQLEGISPFFVEMSNINQVPVVTALVIAFTGAFMLYFTRTKLGQDCRAVGQSQQIANVSGIDVDRTRVIATIISTVIASWGMIIFIQDMGHMSVYTAHRFIGFFSIAAILVGGATAARANVKNAFAGLLLFHAMMVLSPEVGRFISGDGNVGEYLRSLMVYGSIGLSLGLYVWKTNRAAREKERLRD